MRPARAPLGPAVYPALLGLHLALYFLLVRAGLAFFVAYGVAATSLMLACVALERARPYCRAWQRADGQTAHDLVHLVFGSILGGSAGRVLGRVSAEALVLGGLHASGGLARHGGLPFALRFALALALADAGRFAWHWGQHHVPLLWRLHRLHHDAPRVAALKSGRAHLASYALQACATALPVFLAGLGRDALAASVCVQGLVGILAHANVDFDERWVSPWLQSPAVHRLHHRLTKGAQKVNLAATFNLFDRAAGTLVAPAPREEEGALEAAPFEVGVEGGPVSCLLPQLLLATREPSR